MIESTKKLQRSRKDSLLGGVLGGLGKHYDIDATKLRIVYALVTVFSAVGPGIIVYLILWFLIPLEDG